MTDHETKAGENPKAHAFPRKKKGGKKHAGHQADKHHGRGARHDAKKKHKIRHEFSAGFILFRDSGAGRLYLLLDYGKHWDYAKGHLEEGESAWQAAVRELREETGIRQVDRVGRFQKDMTYDFYSPKKGRVHKTVTYFAGRTRTESVTVSDEHTGYAWLPYDQAMQQLTYDNARDILSAAHAAIEATLKRQQSAKSTASGKPAAE